MTGSLTVPAAGPKGSGGTPVGMNGATEAFHGGRRPGSADLDGGAYHAN